MRLVRPAAGEPAGVASLEVNVIADGTITTQSDVVTMEEPLEIRLVHGPERARIERSVAVTMRTPGDDLALALGFLYGEGVVRTLEDVIGLEQGAASDGDGEVENIVRVELAPTAVFDPDKLTRNVYTTSSCGICGKASLDAVRVQVPDFAVSDAFSIDHETMGTLPERLGHVQEAFARTGGIHASGAFDAGGRVVAAAEDVGRHNALDKLIGRFLAESSLPMTGLGLIFSGRASFELVQKAAMAGCPFIAAIGPPSSLAVELAAEQRMTLVGFLREHRSNVYTMPHRVLVEA